VISSIRIVLFERVSIHEAFFYVVLDIVGSYIKRSSGRKLKILQKTVKPGASAFWVLPGYVQQE
jgi:hypothetical protein